ncbi:MAG: hypothetical protein HY645_03700 [Acidobacteria bacterium]|nr:hypothetical protein [Acidobacteriota bacterium]
MKKLAVSLGSIIFGLGIVLALQAPQRQPKTKPLASSVKPEPRTPVSRSEVDKVIRAWMRPPQQTARKMINKYGLPDEVTPFRLVWHSNGPWKRTELVNDEIPHFFPKPHNDMLLQTINYRVPPDRIDELAAYDGSVIAERTKGELSARCDMEEANFLALNLADEIIRGEKNVENAREFHAEAMRQMRHPNYKQGFLFEVSREDQGDPDRELVP